MACALTAEVSPDSSDSKYFIARTSTVRLRNEMYGLASTIGCDFCLSIHQVEPMQRIQRK